MASWSNSNNASLSKPCNTPCNQVNPKISCIEITPVTCEQPQPPCSQPACDKSLPPSPCGSFCENRSKEFSNCFSQKVEVLIPGGKISHPHRKFENKPMTICPEPVVVPSEVHKVPARTYELRLRVTIPEQCITIPQRTIPQKPIEVCHPPHHHCEPDCHYPAQRACIEVPLQFTGTTVTGDQARVVKVEPVNECAQNCNRSGW